MNKRIATRHTKQKTVILEEIRKTKCHPAAEHLFLSVKKRIPSISLATVYRNLNQLSREGKITALTCDRYRARFDGDISDHSHFYCQGCHKVYDIYDKLAEGLDNTVSEKTGFEVSSHKIDFYGLCPACKGKKHD